MDVINRMRSWLLALAFVATIGGSGPAVALTLFDGTFADAQWVGTEFFDSTPGQTGVFSAGQVGAGGNPGSYRLIYHEYTIGSYQTLHLSPLLTVDPSVVSIQALTIAFDVIAVALAQTFIPVLQQGGDVFEHGAFTAASSNWQSVSYAGLVAADFDRSLGTGSPDFSSSGALITFGFIAANTGTSPSLKVTEGGIDSYSVVIVPEPSTGFLLALGMCGVRVISRWRVSSSCRRAG